MTSIKNALKIGTKLKKVATQGSPVAQSDYVGGLQYENNTLAFMQTPEGRVVKNGSAWNFEYYLQDHLGNNRVVFAYTNNTDEYKATMEIASQSAEEAQFKNLPATRVQIAGYNHTSKSYQTLAPDRVAETNGYTNKPVGPSKFLQVRVGDQINAEAYARYATGTSGSTAIISNLVAAVTGAYGIGAGEAAYSGFTNNLPAIAGALTANASVPKAYLIYILFSNNFSSYQFGYQMVSVAAQAGPEKLTTTVTVPAGYDNGFLYIYVANESNVASASSVYFDDVYIKHIKAALALQVTQVTDYYPFGLAINPLGYQKNSSFANKYLYNGKEFQSDFSLNWLDYGARMYMPEIGRWGVVDPMSENARRWSPYRYAFDNPMRFIDPDGMFEYSDGYSTHDSKYETRSVEHNGTFQGNDDEPSDNGKSNPPIKLKDASFQDILSAFQYAHEQQYLAAKEGRDFDLNIYDLFDPEGAPIQNHERVGNYFEKKFNVDGSAVYVFILLPQYRKDARIDASTTFFPGEPPLTQKGFRMDLDNVRTDGVPRGYGFGIYPMGIKHGRLAAVEFDNKDTFIKWRAEVFNHERKFQIPSPVKLPEKN